MCSPGCDGARHCRVLADRTLSRPDGDHRVGAGDARRRRPDRALWGIGAALGEAAAERHAQDLQRLPAWPTPTAAPVGAAAASIHGEGGSRDAQARPSCDRAVAGRRNPFFVSVLRPHRTSGFPPGSGARTIATNGTTIHVRVGGKGPAVVLLHGYGETGDMWVPMAADLARDHTVIVPDLRGMGLSSQADRRLRQEEPGRRCGRCARRAEDRAGRRRRA